MRLKGKVAIVTGASRGIGRAIALRFALEGAKVVINYNPSVDKGKFKNAAHVLLKEITAQGGEATTHPGDVASRPQMQAMVAKTVKTFGRLDIMVANAGICPFKEFLNIDEALLERVLATNLKGAFYSAQAAMQAMVNLKIKGRIIFTSSVSAEFGGEMQAHYCPTKGGINQLMKSVAIAAGKYGITSNAVMPGTVVTDINKDALKADPNLKKYFIKRTPLGRLATPEDVAAAMLFFASEDAACVSGATLTVDGGMSINLQ
jgi:L-rhamnose 1-dehydrogenase